MAKIEKIFLRVPPSVKEAWQTAVDETKAPQNQAGIALVQFFLSLSRHQKADLLSGNLEVPDVSDGIGVLDAWESLPDSDQEFVFEQIAKQMKAAKPSSEDRIEPINLPQTAKINQVDKPNQDGEKKRKPKAG